MPLIYFPISALINLITSVTVALMVIYRNLNSALNKTFVLFALSVAFWSLFYFFWQISRDNSSALLFCRILMVGAIFIPSTFFHFSTYLVETPQKYLKFVTGFYVLSFLFLLSDFTPLLVLEVKQRLMFNFWPVAGILYLPYLCFFGGVVIFSHYLLFKYFNTVTGDKRPRIKYVFLGTLIGFIGGATNYPLWFNIKILPYGNVLVSVYVFLVAFSIIKYRLMDIRLALSNAVIFIIVFVLVLGFPFYVYYKVNTLLALISAMVLGIFGPLLFSNLRKGAENKILEEQKRYQRVLESTLENLNRFKTIKDVVSHICNILFKSIRLKSVAFYVKEGDKLVIQQTNTNMDYYAPEINNIDLIKWLTSQNSCLLLKELHHNNHNNKNILINLIPDKAEMVVPLIQGDSLVGLLLLGEKSEKDLYNDLDFKMLNKVSKEIALAVAHTISNAALLETEGKRIAQENEIKRLKQHELFSKNIAHTFNNPLNMINSSLGTFDDIHELYRSKIDPEDFAALENESKSAWDSHRRLCKMCDMLLKKGKRNIAKAVLLGIDSLKETILDPNNKNGIWEDVSSAEVKLKPNIDLTEEQVRGIVKNGDFDKIWSIYHQARKGVIVLRKIKVSEILEGFDIQKKSILSENNIKLSIDIENNCSKAEVLGDDVRIVEGLIVYLNNSCQAVSKNVDSKKVELKVYKTSDEYIRFEISDNGSGIDEMVKEGLFEVSASTKGSDGNGIGLLFVRQDVCEEMPGSRCDFSSEGRGKGAKFWLDFKIINGQ